ncbi:response regulator transcription factor [Microbacterium schleiferi]|uniref:Response regulator transcription factor n=1 Tax=Microbacterium schleiferi TaxID=69362 RepID=A0A7S8RGT7_9MICO|nr:response regulator transcription factor [Microbacterium schleiferi]QPE03907.1 response regulator transcription factor [Microbacterium schleiferi]
MKILLVEDDSGLADMVRRTLTEAGYAADVAFDAPSGIEAFEIDPTYDLVILDLMLPGLERGGMAVCERIRELSSGVPVLMLTALDSMRTKVQGLDAGADDYVVKPFHVAELLARVRALLRRSPTAHAPVLSAQGVSLDPATRTAIRGSRRIELTAKEFAVLEYLMRNTGRIVSSSELIDHAWDSNYDGFSNVVQTYVRYLRQKLTADGEPDIIVTRRGSGYTINPDA